MFRKALKKQVVVYKCPQTGCLSHFQSRAQAAKHYILTNHCRACNQSKPTPTCKICEFEMRADVQEFFGK
jgi:recombinational DNA repair protein RecR